MTNRIFSLIVAATLSCAAASGKTPSIIPEPASIEVTDSTRCYDLRHGMGVWAAADALPAANYLVEYCRERLGLPLEIVPHKASASIVIDGTGNDDSYTLQVGDNGITINGGSGRGSFYGVQTLIQMLPTRAGDVPQIPFVRIADNPRYQYRGMHLDVVRHFFTVSFVKRFIDWLALHKMNVFHWHLTDDQGWRIEIKSHPELTGIGSSRTGEIKGLFPGEYYDRPHQAYYTQEEIREVIDYAAARYVTVVPEIDIPGHCMAVLAAHPEFSTTPDQPKHTARTWGIYNRENNVLAPCDGVFKLLDDVFGEVCDLFPGEYIHAGGDECAPRWWNDSPETQKFMSDHGIADAKGMQAYFMQYVQRIVNSHGKTVVGWDGGAEGFWPQGSALECWLVKPDMAQNRINTTHKWINASNRCHYFVSHEDSIQTELSPWKSRLTVKAVYEAPLVPDSASRVTADNLIGVEGCCWTEYAPDEWKIEMLVFPRLAALAEKGWCGYRPDHWEDFANRLVRQLDRYDLWRIRYNPAFERTVATPRPR
ncbi:MAG: beta-N-acetylhexosaminidase [Bacteroidales bacterium]|nr:beta-N-acetylhexosaminidase [Candidatus Sodaliphilus aphodohippi]